ncbi:MAG: serine/threonine-protein phosphatase [Candidatus Eremiobacteraeota bacterium]|nr:serine/threonine-protein phosphatase [Candidatus Eremiobacteraeota bacterium]
MLALRRAVLTRRTLVTLVLFVGLLAAFGFATYLSYWGSVGIRDAFAYQSAVVAAQRDSELLEVEQFERASSAQDLRPYEKLLASDLERIDGIAQSPDERAPRFGFPATRARYERLTAELLTRASRGAQRFEATVSENTRTRDISNGLFAVVALLFAVVVGRLRRTIEEGRAIVAVLQQAFLSNTSKRRELSNVDIGSVLLSATKGSNVGGDAYDAFTFDRRYAMFLVADVSGKGLDAALDTALVKYSVRTLFAEHRDPATVLARFGALYARSADRPETFVVLFLAVLDLQTGNLQYASAGHEPAWVRRAGGVTQLPVTGPIAGIEMAPQYETRELMLAPDDVLIVSTDGLTESRDARNRFLGADGAAAWLPGLEGDAQAMVDALVGRLRHRSRRITDDLAILVVRYAPSVFCETAPQLLAAGSGAR